MTAANPDDHDRFYGSPPPPRPADPPAGAAPSGPPLREPPGGYAAPARGYSNYPEREPEPTLRYEEPRGYAPASSPSPSLTEALPQSPPRKRRHWGRRLGITLAVLLVLLVALDRIGVVVGENVAAENVQKQENLPQKPSIAIDGFPFLTQVASKDFSHVTVDIHGLNQTGVPITDLHVDLYGVHVNSSYNGGTADTMNATAQLSYADISSEVTKEAGIGQVTVSEGTGGQLKASYSIVGVTVSASVAVSLQPDNNIKLTSGAVQTPLSGLGISIPNTSGFTVTFPLGTLPFGIQLSGLQITKTYVGISATGNNIPLQESSSSG